jgi:hypothetical protein
MPPAEACVRKFAIHFESTIRRCRVDSRVISIPRPMV